MKKWFSYLIDEENESSFCQLLLMKDDEFSSLFIKLGDLSSNKIRCYVIYNDDVPSDMISEDCFNLYSENSEEVSLEMMEFLIKNVMNLSKDSDYKSVFREFEYLFKRFFE